eukprot:g9101.t1
MVCQKSSGQSCTSESNCETIEITSSEEGCGLKASRPIDLIIQTPASQTQIISTLVKSIASLKESVVPDLDVLLGDSSTEDNNRRKLLQSDTLDDILAVDEGLDSASSSTKSVIAGTGNAQGAAYEDNSDSDDDERDINTRGNSPSTEQEDESSAESLMTSDSSTPSTNLTNSEDNSSNRTVLTGSLSFIVPNSTSSDISRVKDNPEYSDILSDEILTQINQPLMLTGNTNHLRSVDISVPITLTDLAEALDLVALIVEERPWSENSVNLFNDSARLLELMRFKLDSRLDSQDTDETWSVTDEIWWNLQHSTQTLDILTLNDGTQALDNIIERLIKSCQRARRGFKGSEALDDVVDVERRLRNSLQGELSTNQDSESISNDSSSTGNLEDFISMVAASFNLTLFNLYPQQLNLSFSKKYNQAWVGILGRRNKRWHEIKTLVSSRSNMGQPIATTLNHLYMVEPINTSYQRNINHSFTFKQLESLTNEMVGALSASHASKYQITNLPTSLNYPGLQLFQNGPQVTADGLNTAVAQSTMEASPRNGRNAAISIRSEDAVRKHLQTLSVLIDAKITRSANSRASRKDSRGIPETTGILRTVETALDILRKWNQSRLVDRRPEDSEENFYGNEQESDFALSLTGCLVLGWDENNNCREVYKTRCEAVELPGWSVSETDKVLNLKHICVPVETHQKIARLLHTPRRLTANFAQSVAKLFYITTYCPMLSISDCNVEERCLYSQSEHEMCQPSSSFVNHLIKANKITSLAANDDSCRSYLGFPVCMNLLAKDVCDASESCLWTGQLHDKGLQSDRSGICLTDWAQQLFQLNSSAFVNDTQFAHYIGSCQNQVEEESCTLYGLEGVETNTKLETSLPKSSSSSVRPWIVSCLTVLVTVLFLMIICILRKIHKSRHTNSKMIRSKKGRSRKPKSEPVLAKLPPYPMHTYAFELRSYGSSSQSKTPSFLFGNNPLENSETGSQSSQLRVPLQQEPRIDRYTSVTTADISEIQPISEVEEIQSSSESESEESEESWSSTEGWSDDTDEDITPESSSSPQNASSSRV